MVKKYIKVELGGVDCTAYLLNSNKKETYGYEVSICELEFIKTVNSAVTITNALTVEVWQDENAAPTTKIFDGYIDKFEPQAGTIKITAKDQLALLLNKQVMHYYDSSVVGDAANPDGKISDIFIDIVETYGGLDTNSGATIQDSGTDIVLQKFACRNADPFERCRKLADTLGWCFYYRADTGYVYFEPKNNTVNSTVLTVGSNVIEIPLWDYDRSELINDLYLEGAQQLVQGAELFTGDASETVFELTQIPEDIAVYYSAAKNYSTTAKLASEILVGDIQNSIITHDYEVDKKNKKVEITSFVPAASTSNILADISYYAPITVHLSDEDSIGTYGTYTKPVTLTDVITLQDAWKRAENILSRYAEPFKSAVLKVLWDPAQEFKVGQSVKVIDSINAPTIDQYFTIIAINDPWPGAIIELEVGDKQFDLEEYLSNVIERVKRLEESVIGSTDTYTEIVQQTILTEIEPDTTSVVLKLLNDSFALGSTINGLIYDADETANLEDFEDKTDWSDSGLTFTLTDDSTAGHFWVGTQGVKAAWSESSGTGEIHAAISSADMENIVGVASGTPSQGTIGLWIYCTSGAAISELKIRIGSSASDYKEYIAETYAQRNSWTALFSLQDEMNYLVFDLNDPDDTAGTIDWTAIDYAQIRFTVAAASNCTFDYLTASKSNDIGLNGLGDRTTTWSTTDYTW